MAAVLKAIADLNVSPFEAAMGRMEQRASKFASGQLAAIGRTIGAAFSVYAIGRFVSSVGQAADRLDDLSKTTGVGVENLQALEVLFAENGKSAEDVVGVLSVLKKNLDETAGGNTKMAQSIERLKLNLDDVAAGRTDRVLEQIARAVKENAGDMRMAEAAGNLLGRGYASLQGIMNELATQGLDPLRESQKSLNKIMGEDAVEAAARMQEAYEKLSRQMRTSAGNKATEFFGGLTGIFKTGNKAAMGAGAVAGGAGVLTLLALLGGPLTVGASLLAVLGAMGVGATAAGALTTDSDKMAEELFGKPDPGWTAKEAAAAMARRKASIEAIRAAGTARQDKAKADAKKWFEDASGRITVAAPMTDALGKIGGYIGGQGSPAAQAAERQLKIAELQKELQERIAKAAEETADRTQDVIARLED